ncbi:MAG: TonB-dependent receptor domain-containing protein [Terriglobia bacterium]
MLPVNKKVKSGKFVIFVAALSFAICGLFSARTAFAQVAGATLTGAVSDPSGAAVPGATLAIKNTATGIVRNATTDSSGLYSTPNLLPGPYEVTASAKGFSTLVRSGVTLAVGQTLQLNLTLQVGAVSQQVQVTGAPPLVQTATSTVSAQVSGTTVRQLPLNGRDWTSLATLQPGVTAIATQAQNGVNAARGNRGFGNQLSADGHRPNENNYRMDGISINDYSNGAPGSSIGVDLGVDAIQEFSVEETNYSAAYGFTSGGVINAITKSGTNQIHGDAYEFLRNASLDAANFFDNFNNIQKPPFRRNQFGASIGGPIQKDKTFFFGDYEGIRQAQGFSFTNVVPTAAARQGILSTGSVTVSPLVQPYLAFWPLPNHPVAPGSNTGIFSVATNQTLNENFFQVRLDHTFSEKDTMHGSYFFDNAPLTLPDNLNNWIEGVSTRRQMIDVEETHSFTPALINTFRIGFNRTTGLVNTPISAINPLAADKSLGGLPGLTSPGVSGVGGEITPFVGGLGGASEFFHHGNSFQGNDDVFVTHGTHSIQLGGSVNRIQYNLLSAGRPTGSFAFGSLADFLQNIPSSIQTLNPATKSSAGLRSTVFGLYLQDDWRARPNLTWNLGMRYETVTAPTCSIGLCPLLTNLYSPTPAVESPTLFNPPHYAGFQPRVGFAWDLFHNGKTAVRGGFGVFDILQLPYQYTAKIALSSPFEQTGGSGSLPPGSFPKLAFQLVGFNPANFLETYIQQSPPQSYAMNWNLNIQQQLPGQIVVTAGYIGSRSIHGPFTMDDNNFAFPIANTSSGYLWPTTPGTRVNPAVGDIRSLMWNDPASYNSVQLEAKKVFSHGVQFQASYTLGRCIDQGSAVIFGDAFTNSVSSLLSFANPLRNAVCDFNIEQSFVANYLWDVPTPSGWAKGSLPYSVLGGWELGGIFTAQTGVSMTPLIAFGSDTLGQSSTDPYQYPDRLNTAGCQSLVNPGDPNNYIKTNCFSVPLVPTSFTGACNQAVNPATGLPVPGTCMNLLGNAGRNVIVGPGLADFDFSLFKNFPVPRISESFNVQFRAEFFNILNRANFLPPLDNNSLFTNTGAPISTAGLIDATSNASREIQFGVKVDW